MLYSHILPLFFSILGDLYVMWNRVIAKGCLVSSMSIDRSGSISTVMWLKHAVKNSKPSKKIAKLTAKTMGFLFLQLLTH